MNRIFTFFGSLLLFLLLATPMHSATDLEALVNRQAKAWETQDLTTLVEDFADDAVFIATGFTFTGKAEIEKAAADYFRDFKDTKVTIKRTVYQDNKGAVEWDWSDRKKSNDQPSAAEDAIVFELNSEGKIIYWREYIEKVEPAT